MNRDLLKRLEIDENLGLKDLLSELEAKQGEYLDRSMGTSDSSRQAELEKILEEIENEITNTKEELQKASVALVFDDSKQDNENKKNETENKSQKLKKDRKDRENSKDKEIRKDKENSKKREPIETGKPDKLDAKIESIKQQEEKRAASAADKTQPADKSNAGGGNVNAKKNAGGNPQAGQQPSELSQAAAAFNHQDYPKAFAIFSKLAEQDDPVAQHFVSMMYHDGLGMPADWDGFDFWSQKAVANGDKIAMEYRANILMKDGNGKGDHIGRDAQKYYLEALDLFEKAGGPDNLAPLESYVSFVELRSDTSLDQKINAIASCIKSDHVKKAMNFCKIISDNITDSYRKKQWLDRQVAIKKNKPFKVQANAVPPVSSSGNSASSSGQNNNYQTYKAPKKQKGCLFWVLLILGLYLLGTVLVSVVGGLLVTNAKNAAKDTKNSQVQDVPKAAFGEEKIALTDVPEEHRGTSQLITEDAGMDYKVGEEMFIDPLIFRAGNGESVAYADYIPDGKFTRLELKAAPMPVADEFMQNTVVALRIYDLDTTEIIAEKNIDSVPLSTEIMADIKGRRAIRIAVELQEGGNGFANLGYTLVKDAYLIPAEKTEAPEEGNAEENGGEEPQE